MALYREQLSRSRLSMISAVRDHELDRIAQTIQPSHRIHGPTDLADVLEQLLATAGGIEPNGPKTLDLIGHSTSLASLLRLGDWVIDAESPCVTAFFRAVAKHDVLPRLGIRAVRLLACKTAGTVSGRSTLCALADILGVEVFGTNHLLYDAHYDGDGFRDIWRFMLVSSSDLKHAASESTTPEAERGPYTLDIDALPALPLGTCAGLWPQRVATENAVREILPLIRRNAGAPMPGLIAIPSCELALPSAMRGVYHLMHVLFDGEFVRCFPDDIAVPGVVYPVDDPPRLRRIVGALPLLELSR
jgi:hypothetical protein